MNIDDKNATVYAGAIEEPKKQFDDGPSTVYAGAIEEPKRHFDEGPSTVYAGEIEDTSKYAPPEDDTSLKEEIAMDVEEATEEAEATEVAETIEVAETAETTEATETEDSKRKQDAIQNLAADKPKNDNKKALAVIGIAAAALILAVVGITTMLGKGDSKKSDEAEEVETVADAGENPGDDASGNTTIPDYDKSALKKTVDNDMSLQIPIDGSDDYTEIAPTDALGDYIDDGWSAVTDLPESIDPGEEIEVEIVNDIGQEVITEVINPFDTPVSPKDALVGTTEIDISADQLSKILGDDSKELETVIGVLESGLVSPSIIETGLKLAGIEYDSTDDMISIYPVEGSTNSIGLRFDGDTLSGISISTLGEILKYFN